MSLTILVCVLGLICFGFGLPVFECAVGLLLLTPIAAFPLGMRFGASLPIYAAAFAVLFAILLLSTRHYKFSLKTRDREELAPLIFFSACFSWFLYLCHLWPDFYQLGERLRDYAVLSSVVNSPIAAHEPWMSGAPLSYYLYWYRFGSFLHTILNLPTWEVYHELQSFTYALFATSLFVLFRRYMKLPVWGAVFCCSIIAIGSNVEGVIFFLKGDNSWWGPSRVIPGAINEFAAWSFLLGDVHPHYLDLGLIPFLSVCFLGISTSCRSFAVRLAAYLCLINLGGLWIYNSNAWELPAWLALCALLFAVLLVTHKRSEIVTFLKSAKSEGLISSSTIAIVVTTIYLCTALALSSLNIVPVPMPPKLVANPVPRTLALDLLRHWGIPLALIAIATLTRIRSPEWIFAGIAALTSALFGQSALMLLVILIFLNGLRFAREHVFDKSADKKAPDAATLLLETLGLVALILILIPEIVYLDDSYGGENERMNTIFKAYSASWFMLHCFAFFLILPLARKLIEKFPKVPFQALLLSCLILSTGFFFSTIKFRKSVPPTVRPAAQGLSDIEGRFPGSSTVIQVMALRNQGVILEAQGKAYDFTTHIATLSGQTAYLGWANHLNVLLQMYQEVDRRTKFTDDFYREPNCEKKLEMAQKEGISYIVMGPLEKAAYPELKPEEFNCFKEIIKAKEYFVYTY